MSAGNNVRRKSFKSPGVSHDPGPEFDLDGETFRCVLVAPPSVLASMLNSVQFGGSGDAQFRIAGLIAFITGVIADEMWVEDADQPAGEERHWHLEAVDDLERWMVLLRDRNKQVSIEVLGEIGGWLAEMYLQRPTVAPSL